MLSSDRLWRWWLAGAVLLGGGVIAVSLGGRCCEDNAPFNPAAWRAGGPAQRGCMTRSLCAGGFLRGKTRAEVIEMLGEPDRDFGRLIEYDVVSPVPTSRAEWVQIGFDRTDRRVAAVEVQQ
jgi:hypothetical protein